MWNFNSSRHSTIYNILKDVSAVFLQIFKDIDCNRYTGIGKPEPLKYELQVFGVEKIDGENCLVYRIEDEQIEIAQCKTHYEK